MAPGLRNAKFLDGKECWKSWNVTEGSLGAVQDKMLKDGNINPKTGRPPTKSGIEKAAFNWAIENQVEARKDLERAWMREGHVLTEEDWQNFLESAAGLIFHQRPGRLEDFLSQNSVS